MKQAGIQNTSQNTIFAGAGHSIGDEDETDELYVPGKTITADGEIELNVGRQLVE